MLKYDMIQEDANLKAWLLTENVQEFSIGTTLLMEHAASILTLTLFSVRNYAL